MDNANLIALLTLFSGGTAGFLVAMWRISRWATQSEMYSKAHAVGIKDINDRLDEMNGHVRSQGERIARLEGSDD
jgi:hypothetical protein